MNKKHITVIIAITVVIITIAAVVGLINHLNNKNSIEVSGILEANNTEIPSLVSGLVKEVFVSDGSEIEEGMPILKLDLAQLNIRRQEAYAAVKQAEANLEMIKSGVSPAEIRQLQAKVNQASANLQNIKSGAAPEEIAQALTRVQAAQSALDLVSKEYETSKRLLEQEIISETKFNESQMAYNNAKASLKTAQEAFKLIKKGPTAAQINVAKQLVLQSKAALSQAKEGARPAQIKVAMAQIEQAKAELQLIDQAIKDSSIKSPISGNIDEVSIKKGEIITKGTSVANVVDLNHLWVKVFVPETKIIYLHKGQPALIHSQAVPDIDFSGKISYISEKGAFIPPGTKESVDQQVFEVRVSLDESKIKNIQLRPGMTVNVKININNSAG